VFLGGSCDPTKWRAEIAIPMLEKAHITYYNPQRPVRGHALNMACEDRREK
jgi:hypothetical protein